MTGERGEEEDRERKPCILISSFANISSLAFLLMLFTPVALSDDPLYSVCSYNANYTSNSTFQANLNLLLSSLTSNTVYTGYFNDTKGEAPDQVFGLALCRGDLNGGSCSDCLVSSVQSIVKRCPRQKSATIWYDQCLLRYSNQSFFSQASTSFKLVVQNDTNFSEPKRVSVLLRQTMDSVTKTAAYNSSRMFAIENADFTSSVKLYGVALAQCTRDLSSEDCYECLGRMVGNISQVGKQAVEALGQSCVAGYELFDRLSPDESTPSVTPASSPPKPTPTNDSGKGKSSIIKAAAIVIPSVAIIVLVSTTWLCFRRWRSGSLMLKDETDDEELGRANLWIDLATLRHATDNFSDANMLGQGGFGQVYKGVLEDGQEIAVKRLSKTSRQGLLQLKNEVILVAKLHHKNLVRLFGCCLAEKEKLLVYEYLPNSSLDKFLSDPTKRKQLNWGTRYKIIEGIARGLLYLHRDSRLKIIHRDLKASNILLDEDMNPKISDFGLAKLFEIDESRAKTRQIAGTYGYMAPEYAMQGLYSTKSDVFSYGVLVLEIIAGRLNSTFRGSGRAPNLISYAWQHWREGRALQLKDQFLGDEFQAAEILRCVHLGLLCVQEDPAQRPCMATLVMMLSSVTVSLPRPSTPAFFVQGCTTSESETQ